MTAFKNTHRLSLSSSFWQVSHRRTVSPYSSREPRVGNGQSDSRELCLKAADETCSAESRPAAEHQSLIFRETALLCRQRALRGARLLMASRGRPRAGRGCAGLRGAGLRVLRRLSAVLLRLTWSAAEL